MDVRQQTQAGWNAQIYQSTAPNIDIAFAANFPPTNVSGTVSTTGGVFTTGTYYVWVVSTTGELVREPQQDVRGVEHLRTADGGRGSDNGEIQHHVDGGGGRLDAIQGYCVFVNNTKR